MMKWSIRYGSPPTHFAKVTHLKMYGMGELHDILAASDYVVLALPLVSDTERLINAAALEYSKKGQVLINIGRGPLIEEAALVAALHEGKLMGAALDVFDIEPLPESSPLWECPRLIISPHNADMTADFKHKSVHLFTENCARCLAGQSLTGIVNKTLGY